MEYRGLLSSPASDAPVMCKICHGGRFCTLLIDARAILVRKDGQFVCEESAECADAVVAA